MKMKTKMQMTRRTGTSIFQGDFNGQGVNISVYMWSVLPVCYQPFLYQLVAVSKKEEQMHGSQGRFSTILLPRATDIRKAERETTKANN